MSTKTPASDEPTLNEILCLDIRYAINNHPLAGDDEPAELVWDEDGANCAVHVEYSFDGLAVAELLTDLNANAVRDGGVPFEVTIERGERVFSIFPEFDEVN